MIGWNFKIAVSASVIIMAKIIMKCIINNLKFRWGPLTQVQGKLNANFSLP